MKNNCRVLALGLALIAHFDAACACGKDEYEQCWRIELGPLGEARDCKCLPKIPDPIGKVAGDLARELRQTPQALANCIANVGQCVSEIISTPLAVNVQLYIDSLYKQSEGRVQPFSPEFIRLAQPYYAVDLRGITFADNIDTGHGMTVAYCDRIFFAPTNINLWASRQDLHLVLHELEHTVQCQKRGRRTFLAEYVLKGVFDVVKSGRLNVHDVHDFEVAAAAKANQVTPLLWSQIAAARATGPTAPPRSADRPPEPGPYNPGAPYQTAPPTFPLRFCQTQIGTCFIPPVLGPVGSPCYCQTPYGAAPGAAY